MSGTSPRGPMLHPRVTVLRRPSGVVQLGWDPERAMVLEPPGIAAETVAEFLRLLDGLHSHPQIVWRADGLGIGATAALEILADLDAAGLLTHPRSPATPPRVRRIHIHGRGPLSEAIAAGVRRLGLRPTRSRGYLAAATVAGWSADLVILADALVPDPILANDLVLYRIPHLQVRMRDGRGIVGPMVLPGGTSCLRCADLTRGDLDHDWPHLAAQLLGRIGHGSAATITAATALVLRDVETVLDGIAARPPLTLGATLELDPDSLRIDKRHWPVHAACGCRTIGAPTGRGGTGTVRS
ncbi:hypothetical protein KO481_33950 [Nocardia sp. NEAU-G5]|uniref:Bacteriocin biosynthesis cyclodehydratase domain-containing protein n=1 Tax=Nocardia albiluteola TaxID=2842303 RepID=A0ABS6B881_9NOCA|nr:hypothetical protein [Nocardia albiluteola]MBU3066513.1 hypothetical protein [Nocardia albiluteola]